MGGLPQEPMKFLVMAQQGDAGAREELIRSYTPFVMRVAAKVCGRYISVGRDDESSVALLAFNEAIAKYQSGRGSFLRFSETVIRRRLVDYHRGQGRWRETPLSEMEVEDDEGGVYSPAEVGAALAQHRAQAETADRREDIIGYQKALAGFDITLSELARSAPKHRDARDSAKAVAKLIASRPAYVSYLKRYRILPLKDIEAEGGLPVSRKTLERNRKYIIALILILTGEFEHLKGYVSL